MEKKWLNLGETGQLYLEQILVTFDIPILFVCNGFENRKYLCLNVDEEVGTTVIAETDNETLLAMLQNKLTMETVFRNSFNNSLIIAEYDTTNDEIVTQIKNSKEISEDFLPTKGEFFEFSNQKIKKYITSLEKQLIKINTVDTEEFCEGKTFTISNKDVESDIYFSVNSKTYVCCNDIRLSDAKIKYSYEVYHDNEKMIA